MTTPLTPKGLLFVAFLFSYTLLSAQQPSSLYADSRVVSDFLKKDYSPIIDFSQLSVDTRAAVVLINEENRFVSMPANGRFVIPDSSNFHQLILNLAETDTVFVRAAATHLITNASPDTIKIQWYKGYSKFENDTLVESRNILAVYGPSERSSVETFYKLGYHCFYNQKRSPPGYLFMHEVKSIYGANPFTARPMLRKSFKEYGPINSYVGNFYNFQDSLKHSYPWTAVLRGDSIANFSQKVSYETRQSSYRDQIITSEKALSLASEEINRPGQQGGLLDAQTVAVGLSDFIAERAQEELNLTFFERFKTNMLDTNELTILFPKTRELLFDFEISNYKTLLSHARGAFETDLSNIGLNFPNILSLPKYELLRNDPNVFNLALIYSLADLAYDDQPVENILLYACQMLEGRKKELHKAISLRLAETMLGPDSLVVAEMNIPHFEMLNKQSILLLNELEQFNELIKSISAKVYNSTLRYSGSGETQSKAWLQRDFDLVKLEERNKRNYFNEAAAAGELIKMELITGKSEDVIRNKYFLNRIPLYLKGKKYYGVLFNGRMSTDVYDVNFLSDKRAIYDQVFRNAEDDPKENYIIGIDLVRSLREEPLLSTLHDRQVELIEYIDAYKQIEKEYILNSIPVPTQGEILDATVKKIRLLWQALQQEESYWREIGLNEDDHFFKGLQFLNRMFQSKFDFHELVIMHQIFPISGYDTYNDYLNDRRQRFWVENEIEYNFKQLIFEVEAELEEFEFLFHEQQEKLIKAHGDKLISPQKHEAAIITSHLDVIELNLNAQAELNNDAKMMATENKITRSDIRKLDFEINAVYTSGSEEDSKKQDELYLVLDSTYNAIMTEVENYFSTLSDRYDLEWEALEAQKEIMEPRLAELRLQDSIENKAHSYIAIGSVHTLEENEFIQQYENVGAAMLYQDLDKELLSDFREIDSLCALLPIAIDQVNQRYLTLGANLDSLESTYCSDLLEADRNARNLSSSMEISMHLLSAFQVPVLQQDSMFIYDTTRVRVQVELGPGMMKTFDTIQINKKYLNDQVPNATKYRWMTVEEFDALRYDTLQWDVFLGMVYERMRRVEGAPNFSPAGVALLTNKFFYIVQEIAAQGRAVRLKKALRDEIGFKDYYPFIKSTVDLFNTVINTPSVGKDQLVLAQQFAEIRRVSEISDEALSLYENMYIKDYGNAIRNAMALLSIFTSSNYQPEKTPYHPTSKAGVALEKDDGKVEKMQRKKARQSQLAINAVLTYGTFMAEMIDAQTSAQVQTILQSATLPPGSSRIKREVSTSFTINSYLGGAAAYDRIQNDLPGLEQGAIGASLSVPIGFTYSFSPDRIFKQGGSFSIHVPVFDLGAITAFRTDSSNDDYQVEQLPEFGWRNLFSPGAFFVWNIRNSPFSVGGGGQLGPQLRQITDINTATITSVNSTRFPMVFFSVDVPFFNLHTGAKKIVVD